MTEDVNSEKIKKLEENLKITSLENQINIEKKKTFNNGVINKFLIGIFGIVTFVIVTFVSMYIFSTYGIDSRISPIFSLIAGAFTTYIVLMASGIVKEFTIKGGSVELSTKLQEEIKNVKKETEKIQSDIELISQKIDMAFTNISNTNSKSEIKNIENYYESKEALQEEFYKSGITQEKIDPRKKISTDNLKELDDTIKRVEILEDMVRKEPNSDIDYLMKRANYYYYKKDYLKAIQEYDHILKIEPDKTNALFNKGYALHELNRGKEAVECYTKYLILDPDNMRAHHNLAVVYDQLGEYEKALRHSQKALDLEPNDVTAINGKVSILLRKDENDTKEAEELIQRAEKINPNDPGVVYNKSCIYSLKGDVNNALFYLEKAISLDSENKEQAKTDKDFRKFRNDPRFIKLIS